MNMKQDRKMKYKDMLKTNPYHADGYKRFIYTDKKEKDDYALIQKIEGCRKTLKSIANDADGLFDEELDDLRYFLKSQLGAKNCKKLAKIFTL